MEISEINSGCICCSMSGDFVGQLKTIVEWEGPDRILIEPSGVAKLSDLRRSVEQVRAACREDDVRLNSLTTVVDAVRCASYLENFGEFYLDQIQNAQCIVLSRTDGLDGKALAACTALLRGHAPGAALVTTPWEQLSAGRLREAIERTGGLEQDLRRLLRREESCPVCGGAHDGHGCCHDHEHHHHGHDHGADEVFASWGAETARSYSEDELLQNLVELKEQKRFGGVLRAKGAVAGTDGRWHYFDYVPGDFECRAGEPAATGRVCVIGTGLEQDALSALFRV